MNLFNNSNNNKLDRILKPSSNNNIPGETILVNRKFHKYIANNQSKRKQKQNQNNANQVFFSGKNK